MKTLRKTIHAIFAYRASMTTSAGRYEEVSQKAYLVAAGF